MVSALGVAGSNSRKATIITKRVSDIDLLPSYKNVSLFTREQTPWCWIEINDIESDNIVKLILISLTGQPVREWCWNWPTESYSTQDFPGLGIRRISVCPLRSIEKFTLWVGGLLRLPLWSKTDEGIKKNIVLNDLAGVQEWSKSHTYALSDTAIDFPLIRMQNSRYTSSLAPYPCLAFIKFYPVALYTPAGEWGGTWLVYEVIDFSHSINAYQLVTRKWL